jgi:reverse gyrase
LGLNNNKIIIKERNKNGNKETRNKGNLILESRGHRVKSKKESVFKELLNFRNFILGK